MFKQKSSLLYLLTALVAAVSFSMFTGCDSSSSGGDDTSGVDVTVTAAPISVSIGSYCVVEALVRSNSVASADQIVTFSVSPSSGGSCSPAVDTTGADGIAATMFTPTATGSATITASVEGTASTGTANVTVTEEGETGSGSVSMTVNPTLLFANGEDTSRVTVLVRDANANPAPESTLVKLCAGEKFVDEDGNGYWSEGIDSLVYDLNENGEWDAVGILPSVAYTSGATGTASVDFVSGERAGTYYIKATVDESGIEGSDEQSVQLNPEAVLHSIYLASDSINLVVAHTGGIETADLRAIGYDIHGNTVPEGMSITFTIVSGPDGGEFLGTDPLATEAVALTNSQGVATVQLHSGTVSGTVRIRAYSGTVLSNATQVMISAGPPKYIDVAIGEECNYPYWGVVGEYVDVVAVVVDTFMNPVNDSTVVYFTCDEGSMKSHEERTEELEGVAYTQWISCESEEGGDGIVWAYAETAGGTVRDSSYMINSGCLASVVATPSLVYMYPDGVSEVDITVFGVDSNSNFVYGGYVIEISNPPFLSLDNIILEDGCYRSEDHVKLRSTGYLRMDYSMDGVADDARGDSVTYTAFTTCGGNINFLTVVLVTGPAYGSQCDIQGPGTGQPSQTLQYVVTIKDRWGNPLGDHDLNITCSSGSLTVVDTQTNEYGEVYFNWTAPGADGDYVITVDDTDPRGGVILYMKVTIETPA
ncbi:MAG: hypothetical protein JSW34_12435 [Candidatus Zixiibacteriota bacterium]|nr:MAG: hypothetical protein JSW34_12435 [candidate division Zixibacteria bacterium]